ncbi:MAG: hypothetical protein HOP09_06645 [Hyphomicrobium sp.]|nr:hypothetical protein [Hyphomicrobium sp.]
MADQALAAQSAFSELKPVQSAALSIEVRDGLTIASIAAGKGKAADVRAVMQKAFGIDLPDRPLRVEGGGISVIWHGPDQWLAIAPRGAGDRDLESELAALLDGIAAVTDQSDGRAVVRLSGSCVRDVLAKGVPVDLHASAFASNGVAITHASHIGIVLWQIDETPTFEIALFRSFADSFAHWLAHASVEFTAG